MPIISRESVLNRALSAVDTDTEFDIYSSATPPLSAEFWPISGAKIDCSGFIAWCFRTRRNITHPLYRRVNGGWFETSALHRDGLERSGYFTEHNHATPGSLLVYPDKDGRHGHVGLVVEVNGEGIDGVVGVVHCSSGNYRSNNKAIQLTSPQLWLDRDDSIIIDFEGFI